MPIMTPNYFQNVTIVSLIFSESSEEFQDFELPTAAINVLDNQGKVQPLGNFSNQTYNGENIAPKGKEKRRHFCCYSSN